MAGLHLYRSNRLEALAGALAEITREPLASIFAPEIIVVQSLGMRRWLSLELARQHGVAMNVAFPFPAGVVEQLFAAVLPEHGPDPGFSRDLLAWRILGALPGMLDRADGEPLRHYLAGEMSALKGFQLAGKIAAVFDRYLAYRPELILEWQNGRGGPDAEWQPALWRELTRGRELAHAPARAREFSERLRDGRFGPGALPERISVFGISSLPPFYIQLFGEIAQATDVHFFTLEPTPEFWSDLRSRKQQDRILRRNKRAGSTADDLHLETGNPLLASLGKIGREFSEAIISLDPAREHDLFAPPEGPTLLQHVQRDIFQLHDLLAELRSTRRAISPDDSSLQIHSCHSPIRELEVLHDQLLAMFERDPALTPKDILVTMPDVEKYAPYIEAVFGTPEAPELSIPFTIADRSIRSESWIADTFLTLLDLVTSRCGAAAVFALLSARPVRRRFELQEPDLEIIRQWIDQTGIRWGIDGAHRATFDVPPFEENTWRVGLRRLLLGYALAGDEATLFSGLLPVREVEGSFATALGRFVDFADELFALIDDFRRPRPLADWERTLRQVLARFFHEDEESADEIRRLRAAFDGLNRAQFTGGYEAPVPFEVLRAHLAQAFGEADSGSGFLAGRVTFCALKPMRSIPFKVLCLIGMNDTAFPRYEAALAFDLTAKKPRPGDRSLRDDDRQLFLESLLSARDTLYISYCGLSAKDNALSPPSVLVSELLDYLNENFAGPDAEPCEKLVVSRHRLQPFSSDYFAEGSPLFSYSRANAAASRMSLGTRDAAAAFAAEPLGEPDPEWRNLDWEKLANFLAHPAKFFGRDRLGLRLPDDCTPLEEREPQKLHALDRYAFEQDLTRRALAGIAPEAQLPIARATGQLPPGYVGEAAHQEMCSRATELAEQIRTHITTAPLPPFTVDLVLGDFQLTGTLRDVYPEALLRHRAATLKPGDLLKAWVAHLLLQLIAPADHPRETLLFGREEAYRFAPVPDAAEVFADLLAVYAEGLRAPVPLFPRSSLKFAERKLEPSARAKTDPLDAARQVWHGYDKTPGERDEPWLKLCFGSDADPFTEAWKATALRIYAPLFAARSPLA
jgi:exodeoxyribonuclease V gamma subunit